MFYVCFYTMKREKACIIISSRLFVVRLVALVVKNFTTKETKNTKVSQRKKSI